MTDRNQNRNEVSGLPADAAPHPDPALLRRRAEEKARSLETQELEVLSPEETRQTLHELRVHQIELEMQNEELRQTQEELDASRARYFDLYDLAPVGYCTISEKGLILEANMAAAKLLGVARGALVKQLISRFILKEDQDIYYLHRKQLFETSEPQVCQFRMLRANADLFWAYLEATAALDADGAPVCRIALYDITERKQGEDALKAAEETYRNIFLNAQTGIFRTDMKTGLILDANDCVARFIGYNDRKELLAAPFNIAERYVDSKDREKMLSLLKEHGQFNNFETRFMRNDGSIIWMRFSAKIVPDKGWIEGVSEDITERKRAEDALRESELFNRSLVENLPDFIAIYGPDGKILYVNPASATVLGYSAEELVGTPALQYIADEYRREVVSRITERREGGEVPSYEIELLTHDGLRRSVIVTGVQIQYRDIPATLLVLTDITERKRLEQEMTKARAEFLFAVSHELKTPLLVLGATQEMLEILPEEQRADRFRDYNLVWRSNLLRLRYIIENLVDSQRPPGMGMKLEKQPLSAAAVAAEAIKELEPVALTKRVKLILEAEPLPEVALDSRAWKRLLENLLTNAIKFSPAGGEVKIRFTRLDEGFQMAVIDHGSGIAPQAMPFLFKPFYRSPEALRTGIQGTGLGLYVVKMIADAHDCSVEVSSEEGEGTTVTVLFPWGDEGMCRKDHTPSTGKRQALRDTAATSPSSPPAPSPVLLTFIGNSCTLIFAPDGTRIISDPYGDFEHPDGLGALPKDLEADAVTVSHAHGDHNNVEGVGGAPQLIITPGTFQLGMVKITGYAGFEGSPSGPSNNPHIVFVFEINGVKIVHLGDSGPITQPDVLAAIENADVLLANIDGYVIPPDQIAPFLLQAKVRTFIPTHYSLSASARWQGAPTIDEFITRLPADLAIVRQGSEIQVTPKMPKQMVELASLTLIK
ncbi:MAG: PAS domain S-box protein [Coprothermobacterota bacterium]|nr:PAS domain S-box protein [Coprothermobacterota bacterium]